MTKKKLSKSKKPIKVEKKEKVEEIVDDEPSWYHYVIILLILFGILAGIYYSFEFFNQRTGPNVGDGSDQLLYKHKVGNITYNIYFTVPISELEKLSYPLELSELDLFGTISVRYAFQEYNETDNGFISVSAIKLRRFLDNVYRLDGPAENETFVQFNETNCSDSDENHRVITFDPYQDRDGVFVDENGCVIFATDEPEEMRVLVDYFIYETVRQ